MNPRNRPACNQVIMPVFRTFADIQISFCQCTMLTTRLAMDTRMDVTDTQMVVLLPMSEFFAFALLGVT